MKSTIQAFAISLALLLGLSPAAHAEWKSLGTIADIDIVPDNTECHYRLKLSYANPATQDNFFYADHIRHFVNDEGVRYSMSLSTLVGLSEMLAFASAGIFVGNTSVSDIATLYQGDEKPFNERLSALVTGTNTQVSLSYSFFNQAQDGAIYSSTRALDSSQFTLEENCPNVPKPRLKKGPINP